MRLGNTSSVISSVNAGAAFPKAVRVRLLLQDAKSEPEDLTV
jgi:hypothetical protein